MTTYRVSVGTHVRLVKVDKFGFTGRDFHPSEDDVNNGFHGIVVTVVEECEDPDDPSNCEPILCYRVCNEHGMVLDCMDFELVQVIA